MPPNAPLRQASGTSQRASLGLIITEGTQPSEDGQGYLNTPDIYTPEHIKGWRKIAEAGTPVGVPCSTKPRKTAVPWLSLNHGHGTTKPARTDVGNFEQRRIRSGLPIRPFLTRNLTAVIIDCSQYTGTQLQECRYGQRAKRDRIAREISLRQ